MKFELIERWERRVGIAYPDDAPVWFDDRISLEHSSYWKLGLWGDVKDHYTGCVVADVNGKPDY